METKKQNKLPEGLGKKIIQALKEQGSSSPTTLSMPKPNLDNQAQPTQPTINEHGLETITHMDFGSEEFPYDTEPHTDFSNDDNYTPELSTFNDVDIDQNLSSYTNQDFSYNDQTFEELPTNFESDTYIEPPQDFNYQDYSYNNNIPDLDSYEPTQQNTAQEDFSGYQPELNLDYNYLNHYDNFEYQDNAYVDNTYIDNESENATFQTQEQQEFYQEETLDSSNYEPTYSEINHTPLDLDAIVPQPVEKKKEINNTIDLDNHYTSTEYKHIDEDLTNQDIIYTNDPLNIEEKLQSQPVEHIGYNTEQISQLEEKLQQPIEQVSSTPEQTSQDEEKLLPSKPTNTPQEQQLSPVQKIQEIVEQIDFMSDQKPLFLEEETEQVAQTGFIPESSLQIGFTPQQPTSEAARDVIPPISIPEPQPTVLGKLPEPITKISFIPEQQTISIKKEPESTIKETFIPQQQATFAEKSPEPVEQKEFVFQASEQKMEMENLYTQEKKMFTEIKSFYNNDCDFSNSKILSPKVEKLIALVSTLPPGVTRQTGAQIIRQTMEAMGIVMSEVLSDAQESQSQLQQQIKESFNRIEEEKILIKTLENDIHKYQYKSKELEEVIKLFVLSDRR